MSFSKSFYLFLSLFMFILISFFCFSKNFGFSLNLYYIFSSKSLNMISIFNFDKISLMFLMMVSFVTSLVLLFSEYYLDLYNNKKFLVLTLFFFLFMSILSLSEDLFLFILGWDGLGISSLFLIMFYPNKITLYNSFLTLFFNRLGDIFLIIFFCLVFSNSSLFFNLSYDLNFLVFIFLFICLLTKSAQFPLSSWLPAAMSAPTPISAMVHSSTLVTAGIVIFFKMFFFLVSLGAHWFLLALTSMTFLMGGFLGSLEKDLKKIVAFSTMSQISMILLFLSFNYFSLSMIHTFSHALFKTLLFCCCGILFTWSFSNQLSSFFHSKNFNFSIFYMVIFSIFSMSGLSFSSSFFSKDMILEGVLNEKDMFMFFILFLGSSLTLIYSSSIMNSFNSLIKSFSVVISLKIVNVNLLMIFSFLALVYLKLIQILGFQIYEFFLSSWILFFLNLFFLFILYNSSFFNKKFFLNLSSSVYFMKDSSFSIFSNLMNNLSTKVNQTDSFFFKPSNFSNFHVLKWKYTNLNFLLYLILSVYFLI